MSKIDIKPQPLDSYKPKYLSTPRSLRASALGIEKARKAFKQTLWTQEYLASEVGIQTRQPIWKFFSGKPIERHVFIEICLRLDLDWQEIADLPTVSLSIVNEQQVNCLNIDPLVQVVRTRRYDKIQAQCGTIRLLDVAQLIQLNDIYVSVNILETLPSQNWIDISNIQGISLEEFNSFECSRSQEGISALEAVAAYSKLMVLGKSGSGKTTLLQHIAMQCNQGELLPEKIPIFIRLRNFAEDVKESGNFSLLNYISQEFEKSSISAQQLETLLNHGKALILMDGLDEVQENSYEVLKQIRKLSEEYYKNQLIITSRLASQHYRFEGFTDIQVTDFDQSQIAAFAKKWFVIVGRTSQEKGLVKAAHFLQSLQLPENWRIRELAGSPLLLNLVCSVFQTTSNFPINRSNLYRQAIEILLVRWDEARGIKRDEYRHLSLPHKLKLLSQIAATNFDRGRHFFAQSNVQRDVMQYLRTLPTVQTEPEVLQINSETVLRAISAQHGLLVERAREIYSFSHLTFQEYLTAKNFATNPDPQILNKNLFQLVSHMTETRWREVLLLTVGMLENADNIVQLMQHYSNQLIAVDQQLQHFFVWLHQKSLSVQASYKLAGVRAFYLTLVLPCNLTLARDLSLALAIDPGLAGNLAPDLELDIALNRALCTGYSLPCNPSVDHFLALSSALPDERVVACQPGLQRSLQQLKQQLPALNQCREGLQEWWSYNGQNWVEKLRFLMIMYCNIGHQWQFSEQQKEVLQQYYAAQQLLVDCLNSASNVTSRMCKEAEESLLLPIAKIEHRKNSALAS